MGTDVIPSHRVGQGASAGYAATANIHRAEGYESPNGVALRFVDTWTIHSHCPVTSTDRGFDDEIP